MKKTKLITKEMEDIILNGTFEEQLELHFTYGDKTYCFLGKSLSEEFIVDLAHQIRVYGYASGLSNKTYNARTFRVGKYFTVWRGI